MAALAVGLLLASGTASAVWGTTLVPMTDGDLVRTSSAIVTGTVRRIRAVERRDGGIVTEVTVALERRVKGRPRGSKLVVTVPGGTVGGTTATVLGTPEFARGERVLLFLKRGAGGRLRTNALALGKYHIATARDGTVLASRTVPGRDVRRLDAFLGRLGGLAAGQPSERVGNGRAPDAVAHAEVDRFSYLGANPTRWFEQTVAFRVAGFDSGLGGPVTGAALANAMGVWTNVPSASIVLATGTPAAPTRSLAGGLCDGASVIQFDDPFGEVQDMTNCSGVLAIGGFCSSSATMTVNGTTYRRIIEGDVTLNQNVGSCWGATNVAEVLTHEIGHAIGLGHSTDAAATMFAYAHFDGRGAVVAADDQAGATALYPVAGATTTTSSSTTSSTSSTSSTSTTRSTTTSSSSSTSTSSTTSSTAATPTVPTTSSSSSTTSTTRSTTSTTSSSTSTTRSTTTSTSSSTSTTRSTTTSTQPTTSTTRSSTSTTRSTTTTTRSTTSTTRSTTTTSTMRSTTSSSSSSTTTTTPAVPTTSTTLPPGDADGDGVADEVDACPASPEGEMVDARGCSVCPCGEMRDGRRWRSRTSYLRCVKTESRRRAAAGRMDRTAARNAVRQSITSTCARTGVTRCCLYRNAGDLERGRGACRILDAAECASLSRSRLVHDAAAGSCLPNPCD